MSLNFPRRKERLQEELQSHLQMDESARIDRGQSPDEARASARREFGNAELIQGVTRDQWGWRWLEDFVQDVRYGIRVLTSNIAFTGVVVLTLAIGIGANATIFSWIRAVLLNPLPGVGGPERVVELESLAPSGEWFPTSYLDFRDFRDHLKLPESMSVAQPMALSVGDDVHVERVWGEAVSGNFFDALRVQPEQGRFFAGAERDDTQNAHPVLVISHAYWASHFNRSAAAVGSTIRVNRTLFTIIGVTPKDFHGSMPGLSFDVWLPATMYGQLTATGTWMLEDRKTRMFRVLARLWPGVTMEQAREELESLAKFMSVANADTSQGMSATYLPVWKSHYGIQTSLFAPLTILLAASGVVLLIVCANIANLLLVRSADRRKEFCIRVALGASQLRIMRQLMTEVLILAGLGSIAGLLIASWLGGSLRWLLPVAMVPSLQTGFVGSSAVILVAALALCVVAIVGIGPALEATRGDVNETLKEGGRGGSPSARSHRLRTVLVISEVALAVVALISAGLFVKSFYNVKAIRPGFDPNGVVVAKFDLSAANFNAQQGDAFCRHLREKLEAQPAVTAVTYADYVPLSPGEGSWEDLKVEGYVPGPSENMKIYRNLVAPGYFGLVKIPVIEGRDFDLHDDRAHPPVMIVTREFVRRFIPQGQVLSRKVYGWGRWFTVVGVVEDSKIYRLTENPRPYFYVPIRQIYRPEMGLAFYVRTSGASSEAIKAIRNESQSVDALVPPFDVMPLREWIAGSTFTQSIAATLLTILASIAFVLAAVGLYGVIAHVVTQRTQEFGIRLSLGAQRRDVLSLILKQALVVAVTGMAIGAALAISLGRVLKAFLVGLSPSDPLVYVGAAAIVVILALAATAIPGWRAMSIDPVRALRHE